MLNDKDFDSWSDEYDQDVIKSDENGEYPFAGYRKMHRFIYDTISERPNSNVLEVGIGTGVLASKLRSLGCEITGLDFSDSMIEISKKKIPDAVIIKRDITLGLPEELKDKRYEYITSNYTLHHLNDDQKVSFLIELLGVLKEDGTILIGDVAFTKRSELDSISRGLGDWWDKDEVYFVVDEIKEKMQGKCKVDFVKFSECTGVLVIKK